MKHNFRELQIWKVGIDIAVNTYQHLQQIEADNWIAELHSEQRRIRAFRDKIDAQIPR
ncbi:MAG: hypothetical protein H7246_09185 [Phycisphaerae bacterium]|nr:hypothetical protein [Saprospiraceae bacterium]